LAWSNFERCSLSFIPSCKAVALNKITSRLAVPKHLMKNNGRSSMLDIGIVASKKLQLVLMVAPKVSSQ